MPLVACGRNHANPFSSPSLAAWVGLLLAAAPIASAASPTVEQALKLAPVQQDVDFEQPGDAEIARSSIKAEQIDNQTGWVVRGAGGQVLRRFVDTNGDNVVDQWCYYQGGLEVYRDVDSNFNGKADEYRWLNTGGSRWGLDDNEDGQIDAWKRISAEEVSAEVVRALAERDEARFERLLLTANDLKSLDLGKTKTQELKDKLEKAVASFKTIAGRQNLDKNTRWVDFSGTQPGVVPAGTAGIAKDLLVYENVMAMVESDGKHSQVQIGTLVQVGDAWRLVDAPGLLDDAQAVASGGFFFTSLASRIDPAAGTRGGPDGKTQELLARLEELDEVGEAADPEQQAKAVQTRCDLLEEIAASVGTAEERRQWLRQLADTVSAAVQAGTYPEGVERLQNLQTSLESNEQDAELAAYVRFRYLTAEYGLSLQSGSGDFAKIQTRWLENLKKYVDDYPNSPDTAEAMLQLGIAEEFAGEEVEAKKWYGQIVKDFPESPSAHKAAGARTRLDCVGKTIDLEGTSPRGKKVSLASFRRKVVLIQYWATWCEPCKADLAQIKELQAKYGKDGFSIISISLDSRKEDLDDFLKSSPLPWSHIFEPGGLDSRLANELGILTLPTMLLVDQQGKVVNRNIHVTELDREVRSLLREK